METATYRAALCLAAALLLVGCDSDDDADGRPADDPLLVAPGDAAQEPSVEQPTSADDGAADDPDRPPDDEVADDGSAEQPIATEAPTPPARPDRGELVRTDLTPFETNALDPAAFESLVASLIDVLRGDDVVRIARNAYRLTRLAPEFAVESMSDGSPDRVVLCPDGGSAEIDFLDNDVPETGARYALSRCTVGELALDGGFSFRFESRPGNLFDESRTTFATEGLRVERAGDPIESLRSERMLQRDFRDVAGNVGFVVRSSVVYERETDEGVASYAHNDYFYADTRAIPALSDSLNLRGGLALSVGGVSVDAADGSAVDFRSVRSASILFLGLFDASEGVSTKFGAAELDVEFASSDGTSALARLVFRGQSGADRAGTVSVVLERDAATVQSFSIPWADDDQPSLPASLLVH